MIVDDNLNFVSQNITSYFESPSDHYFSTINEHDKGYVNDNNTNKNMGFIYK